MPRAHTLIAIMIASVPAATASPRPEIGSSGKLIPMNFEALSGTRDSPTMSTTSPVISGGNRKPSRWISRAKIASIRPAAMVMPRIRGSPPSQAAFIETPKKLGPHRLGHRNPEPKPRARSACAIVPMPHATMVRATTPRT